MLGEGCPKCCGEGEIHAICLAPSIYKNYVSQRHPNEPAPILNIVDCDNCDGKGIINIRGD